MNELFQFLTWDSQFFGLKVVRLLLPKADLATLGPVLHTLAQDKVQLAYWFISPHDEDSNQAAQSYQGLLVDKKVSYTYQCRAQDILPVSPFVQVYNDIHPTQELIDLSLISGEYSRFKIDPHFGLDNFTRLYQAWMINSVNKKIADQVLVYKQNGPIVGMITLGQKGTTGQIGLFAVHPHHWGQSIGQSLMYSALQQFKMWEVRTIQVITQQANQRASRFYERYGFRVEHVEHVYHFWL